jgi:hypothetical protein
MRRLIGKAIVALVSVQLLTALLASMGGATSPRPTLIGAPALAADFGGIGPLSCASAGNCAAGGSYEDSSGNTQAFVVDETAGTWGKAKKVPGTASLNVGGDAYVLSLSCASAGNCAAGGSYEDSSGHTQAFVVDETPGTWGNAEEVPGTAKLNKGGGAYVSSVSCGSAGNCAAGGNYVDNSGYDQVFVVDEMAGTWGNAEEVPGTASLNVGGLAFNLSLSCASAGNCAAAGTYEDSSGYNPMFVVNETAGTWGKAKKVQGTGRKPSGVTSVSCGSVGSCTASGWYENSVAIVVNETAGTWGRAEVVPGITTLGPGGSQVSSLSCASAGNCAAGGVYVEMRGDPLQPYVVDETAGTWGPAKKVPGMAKLSGGLGGIASVSCGSAGNCAAVGSYEDQAFVVDETAGTWGKAEEIT